HPSGYSVELGPATTRRPLALGKNDRLTFPPSLGAKYRGLWKTCQGKIAHEPQNVWASVSKLSTGSGSGPRGYYAPTGSECAFRDNTRELTRPPRSKKIDNGLR